MAIVYFTNNASSGSGSLVEAIANAQSGDVVRPDESVFERGSIIEIALASSLNVEKNLSFDGGPFRVRLNGGGSVGCAVVATGVVAEFTAFDFIGGVAPQNGGGLRVESGANVVLSRCRVCGCDAAQYGGGIYVDAAATLTANDSAIFGNRAQFGGGIYIGDDAAVTLNGATVCGNVDANAELDIDGETLTSALVSVNSILRNAFDDSETSSSVVGVASSTVGFVEPPPDDLTVDNWNANAWRNWDLRLLDDASGDPSPYRDSGDVGAMSRYDLDGNFRGRKTNGVATCSPGAYETIQADLFWVGRDATGAEVVSPSFLTSDGWAASRFATVAGDVAPQAGQTVFVDGDVSFVEFLSKNTSLAVGGGAVFASSDYQINFYASKLQVGLGATFKSKFTSAWPSRVGAWARLTMFGAASATVDFDVASQADYFRFAAGKLSTVPLYGRLELRPAWALSIEISDKYDCSSLTVIHHSGAEDLRIKAESATFRVKTVEFTRNSDNPSDLFDAPVVVELRDAAKVTVPDGAPESWADAFEVDATDAASATLILNGQTVYGDAPTCAVSLTGSARIDGAYSLTVASLTFAEGTKVEFTNDASVILTTVSATAVIATGYGAFFAPIPAPVGLTLENGALWCDASAAVTSIDVDPLNATAVKFTVAKTIEETNIVVQYSVDGGSTWSLVETEAGSNVYELEVPQGSDVTVRVATLSGWLSDTVSTAPFLPVWVVSNAFESFLGVSNVFEVATGGSNDGLNTYDFSGYGYF